MKLAVVLTTLLVLALGSAVRGLRRQVSSAMNTRKVSHKIRTSMVVKKTYLVVSESEKLSDFESAGALKLGAQIRNYLAAVSLVFPVLFAQPALAVNGEYGILEGVFAGMLHPVAMLTLYGISLTAAYHGIKWRTVRTLADDIKEAKAQGEDDATVKSLQEQRSKLISGEHRDKHVALGSILLGTGVGLALEGGLSTYWRVGEIFPGEHLFAGLGLVAIWAISYAISPLMIKGNVAAKNIHFGANIVGLGLFTWQILSGWEGMVNVFNAVPGW